MPKIYLGKDCNNCCHPPEDPSQGCLSLVCDWDRSYAVSGYTFTGPQTYNCFCPDSSRWLDTQVCFFTPDCDTGYHPAKGEWDKTRDLAWYCNRWALGGEDPYLMSELCQYGPQYVTWPMEPFGGKYGKAATITPGCSYISFNSVPPVSPPSGRGACDGYHFGGWSSITPDKKIHLSFDAGRFSHMSQEQNSLVGNPNISPISWGRRIATYAKIVLGFYWIAWDIDPGNTMQSQLSIHKVRIKYRHAHVNYTDGGGAGAPGGNKAANYVSLAEMNHADCPDEPGGASNSYSACQISAWPTPGSCRVYYGAMNLGAFPDGSKLVQQVIDGNASNGNTMTPPLGNAEQTNDETAITSVSPSGSQNSVYMVIASSTVCHASNPLPSFPSDSGKTLYIKKSVGAQDVIKFNEIQVLGSSDNLLKTYDYSGTGAFVL